MNNAQLRRLTLLITLLIINLSSTFAQSLDSSRALPNGKYLKSFLTDSRDIVIAPIRWSGKEWIAAGAVIGGTVLLFQYDLEIRNYFQSKQSELGKNISKHAIEPWGSGIYSMSTMALFYGQGLIWKNERSKKVALLGVKAYIISGFFVQFPKRLFSRQRPYQGEYPNPNQWYGPSISSHTSFPSGHTTSIFAVAAVVASEYKETIWVPILSYTIATAAGLSRIYDDKHWSSDVFFAAAFGWSIGKLIHSSNNWKVKTMPMVSSESAGLYLNYQF